MKKKSIIKGMLKEGVMLTGSSLALAALPSNDVSPKVSTGFANYAKFYPIRGSMAGMKMSMDLTGRMIRSTKKFRRL